MGPNGKWVEVQIRTARMDEIAEKGYAAHWKYKQAGVKESNLDNWINKIRELLENPVGNAIDFVDNFKMNLFTEEIFIFTPAGDLKTLPFESTALDFAYEIHTQVGSRCLGSKVNGKLVPLSHKLKSGDQVEIITSSKQKPKEDWLNFVKTSRAKSKIKNALKEEKKIIGGDGKEILIRKLRHLKITFNKEIEDDLSKFFNLDSLELYYQFGTGMLSNKEIRDFVALKNRGWFSIIKKKITRKGSNHKIDSSVTSYDEGIILFGSDRQALDYNFAKCCSCIAGDPIFGFTTISQGIKIHNANCPNSIQLRSRYSYRILEAVWKSKDVFNFTSKIKIRGIDQIGLINKVSRLISDQLNVNIESINISSNAGMFQGEISINVLNISHLENLIKELENIEGIETVERL
jgi:GTP pyrophosphokinase